MAKVLLRPDADVSNQWSITDGGAVAAWQVLDDAVEQPAAPSVASDFITEGAQNEVVNVEVERVVVAAVSAAKAWVYCRTTGIVDAGLRIELMAGAVVKATTDLPAAPQAYAWRSAEFIGALTQAEVDDLRIRLTKLGVLDQADAAAAYVELTYLVGGGRTLRGVGG